MEVGAQGTIGSLVCREIEYFRRMEVASHGHGKKSNKAAANGGSPRRKARSAWKKGGGGGAFLPSMCSSSEVAEAAVSGRGEPAARVRYRHLGEEGDSLPQD